MLRNRCTACALTGNSPLVWRTEADAAVCSGCGLVLSEGRLEAQEEGQCRYEGDYRSGDYDVARRARQMMGRLGMHDGPFIEVAEVSDVLRDRPGLRALGRTALAAVLVQQRMPEVPGYRVREVSKLTLSQWGRTCAATGLLAASDPHQAAAFESARLGAPGAALGALPALSQNQCRPLGDAAPAEVRRVLDGVLSASCVIAPHAVQWRMRVAARALELHVTFCAGGSDWPTLGAAHRRARGCAPRNCGACRHEAEILQACWHLEAL